MKFRKKPVVVEAEQWLGWNLSELVLFGLTGAYIVNNNQLQVPTLEGGHIASVGDWIIKGVHGEFYPCKPDIFEQTYEEVKDD